MIKYIFRNHISFALLAGMLLGISVYSIPNALADQGLFSLSSGFVSPAEYGPTKTADMLSTPAIGKYETGPWSFKLTVPSNMIATTPEIGHLMTIHPINETPSDLAPSEAAATYNINSGPTSSFGVNLTGKVKLGLADQSFKLGTTLNDYAAQAEAYQNFDKFKALGSLGYKMHGDPTGINMNKVVYGSVGGAYQLSDQMSGGIDFNLSLSPAPMEPGQKQISAYVNQNINKSFSARGFLLENFTNGSLDHRFGAALSYGF